MVGEVYYLAMEFVDGRDLALILSRCRERKIFLPVHFAVHIALAALDALTYAHAACGPTGLPLNIVHCDVSPSNLFISRLGEIKLGDFGIAKVRSLGGDEEGATLWGKLVYLAPEQLHTTSGPVGGGDHPLRVPDQPPHHPGREQRGDARRPAQRAHRGRGIAAP